MSPKAVVMIVAALALMPAGKSLAAQDEVPGSQCHLSFNTTGPVKYFDGVIFSQSSSTQFIDCPYLNDTRVLRVFYVDSSSAGNFRCYGYKRSSTGAITFSNSKFSCLTAGGCLSNSDPNFASNGLQFLELGDGGGWQGVTCELPPGGSIRFLNRP